MQARDDCHLENEVPVCYRNLHVTLVVTLSQFRLRMAPPGDSNRRLGRFEIIFEICIRTLAPALCIDIVPVFAHPGCQYIKIFWGNYFRCKYTADCPDVFSEMLV